MASSCVRSRPDIIRALPCIPNVDERICRRTGVLPNFAVLLCTVAATVRNSNALQCLLGSLHQHLVRHQLLTGHNLRFVYSVHFAKFVLLFRGLLIKP